MLLNYKMSILLHMLDGNKNKLKKLRYFMEELNMSSDELNINAIAKELNVSWATVKANTERKKPTERKKRVSKVDKVKAYILEIINNDDAIIKSKAALYRRIKLDHPELVDFSSSTFNDYLRKHFDDEFNNKKQQICERFETPPGFQMQFDYKEDFKVKLDNNSYVKLQIGVVQCSHSRKIFRKVLRDKTTQSTIEFLAEAFLYFGGVPQQLVIDNGAALVAKARTRNSDGILTKNFEQFRKDFCFEVYICMSYRPETKGKVERTMQDVNDLLILNGTYTSLLDVSNKLSQITCLYNDTAHDTTKLSPNFLFDNLENEHLKSLPSINIIKKYQLYAHNSYKVDKTGNFKHKQKFYKVPGELIYKNVDVISKDNVLHVYYNNNFVCRYEITGDLINDVISNRTDDSKINEQDEYLNELHIQALSNLSLLGGPNAR